MINWKAAESNEKLLVCMYAWLEEKGLKVDYKRIAALFGDGATYNAVECNFRKIRAQAAKLAADSADDNNSLTPATTPRKNKMPKKEAAGAVLSGRVSKPSTPKKRRVKTEEEEEMLPTPPSLAASMGCEEATMTGADYGMGAWDSVDMQMGQYTRYENEV